MFEKLDGIVERYSEIMEQLNDPNVVNNQENFRKLMKEQSDLAPIVELYQQYKQAKKTIEESLSILDEESDEEMRELAKEELNEAKASIPEMEEKLKNLTQWQADKIQNARKTSTQTQEQIILDLLREHL